MPAGKHRGVCYCFTFDRVANVALVPQAERVGKGGDSPEKPGNLGEK